MGWLQILLFWVVRMLDVLVGILVDGYYGFSL